MSGFFKKWRDARRNVFWGCRVFGWVFIFTFLKGCMYLTPSVTGLMIANQHMDTLVGGEKKAIVGERIGYMENHLCMKYSGSEPCMLIDFSFDVIHPGPGDTLVCMIRLQADPEDIPAFSAYDDGEVRREFTLDVNKIGNPVVLETTIQKDIDDHGLVNVNWACKYDGDIVASADVSVDLGE